MAEALIYWTTPDEGVVVRSDDELRAALAVAEATSTEPLIVTVAAGGAAITHVVGDPSGSTLVYFPAGYPDTELGSMHSVGDRAGRDLDAWEPPQVAYMTGHYSEMPRWMVLPVSEGENALREFLEAGGSLPSCVEWEYD